MVKYLIILPLLFVSCTQKEKTYEELEAEVFCDILPQIINESVSFTLPPPPLPDSIGSSKKSNNLKSQDEIVRFINKKKDSIKSLAQIDKKLKVSIINDLFELEKNDVKLSKELFNLNKIKNREIKIEELKESTLSFEVVEWDSVLSSYYSEKNLTLIRCSRVYFSANKKIAFFINTASYGGLPLNLNVLCKKKKNTWVVEKILKE